MARPTLTDVHRSDKVIVLDVSQGTTKEAAIEDLQSAKNLSPIVADNISNEDLLTITDVSDLGLAKKVTIEELSEKLGGGGAGQGGAVWTNTNNPSYAVGGFSTSSPATPELGLTFPQVMEKMFFPALAPTATLSTSSGAPNAITTLPYLTPNPLFTIYCAATINSQGATISKLKLEWKRGNEVNYRATLLLNLDTAVTPFTVPQNYLFNHSAIEGETNDSLADYNFKLTVEDSRGGATVVEKIGSNSIVKFATKQAPILVQTLGQVSDTSTVVSALTTSGTPQTPLELGTVGTSIQRYTKTLSANTKIISATAKVYRNGSEMETVNYSNVGTVDAPIYTASVATGDLSDVLNAHIITTVVDQAVIDGINTNTTTNITIFSALRKAKIFFGQLPVGYNDADLRTHLTNFIWDDNYTEQTFNVTEGFVGYIGVLVPRIFVEITKISNKVLSSAKDSIGNAILNSATVFNDIDVNDAGGNPRLYRLYRWDQLAPANAGVLLKFTLAND